MDLFVSHHILLALCSHHVSPALHCTVDRTPLPSGPKYLVLVILRREIVAADAKLARAWSIAWSYGRGVCRSAPEEAKKDFDVLVEHGETGTDETRICFDHRPICCWDGANYYVVLDLAQGNAGLNTYMLSLFPCLKTPRWSFDRSL